MATLCPNCGIEFPSGANFCPRCTTADPKPVRDAMCGRVVGGRYRILRRLGQGGMGVVYEAEHVEVGQKVAIKFLHATFSGDPEVARRFHNEARSYAQIVHPHAVQLHDFGRDADGNLYICMEYLEGCDLKKTLAREERLSPKDALDVVQQVADVLGTAHSRGIVHRDLKPENIMLSRELRGYHVKVLDFGLARLAEAGSAGMTAPGMVCGTPRYMAPEQSEGLPIDHRVDLYAAGLVLYECLTGTHPFEAPSISETLRLQRTAPVPHLHEVVPELAKLDRVDAAIQRATAKRPEDRFASMLDFVRAFSDDVAMVGGLPAIAPTAEDVAATSARLAVGGKAEPVGATMPSAPRRQAAKPAPPVASKPIALSQAITPMAAPAGSVVLEDREKAPPKPKNLKPFIGLAVALAAALLAAGWGLRSGGATGGAGGAPGGAGSPRAGDPRRQKLDAFYRSQREPAPPEACREKDPQVLDKLVAALPNLADDASEDVRVTRATQALGTLPQSLAGLSAESAFLVARARVMAGGNAEEALAAATACPNFPAAECLAGKAALKAGRKGEAEKRLAAALAPGYARPRLFLAVMRMERQPDEAFRLLQEAVAIQPDFAEAHFALGRAHDAKSAVANREGNAALAEGERAQSKAAYCKAAELGFAPAKLACAR